MKILTLKEILLEQSIVLLAEELEGFIRENFAHPPLWEKESFVNNAQKPQNSYYFAKIDQELVGYCEGNAFFEEADLNYLVVSQKVRGKKVGAQLLQKFSEELRKQKVEKILLEVRKSNQTAIKFYEKNGFHAISERNEYYQAPVESAVIMEKIL